MVARAEISLNSLPAPEQSGNARIVAARILYTCLPTPDALADVTQLLAMAKLAASENTPVDQK